MIFAVAIDGLLIISFCILKFSGRRAAKKDFRNEARKIFGRYVGTISESTSSKKQAQFMTLEETPPDELDNTSTIFKSGGARRYWYKRIERAVNVIGQYFPIQYNVKPPAKKSTPAFELNDRTTPSPGVPPAPSDNPAPPEPSSSASDNGVFALDLDVTEAPRYNTVEFDDELADSTTIEIHPTSITTSKRITRAASKAHLHYSLHLNELLTGFKRAQNGQDLSLHFEFDNLSLTLPSGKTILSGVNGSIVPGRVTVIMGPSGAGKSTFMNVLMGKSTRTGGRLMINGREVEMHKYKKIIGYVPQEDVMLHELTVRENIAHSARMRLPRSWTKKEIDHFVDAVLHALELSHVAHSLITSISGGQKKRVNIGMELVTCPSAIFLDEPSSGLDATAALKIANIMKKVAMNIGITVVAVIHQPRYEIFEQFDDLLMIAPGGLTAFLGPREDVQSYFENMGFHFDSRNNPADTMMDIISGKGCRIDPDLLPESQVDNITELLKELVVAGHEFVEYEVSELVEAWREQERRARKESHDFTQTLLGDASGAGSPHLNPASDLLDGIHVSSSFESPIISETITVHDQSRPITREVTPFSDATFLNQWSSYRKSNGTFSSDGSGDSYQSKGQSHQRLQVACRERGASFWKQVLLVHNRSMLQQYRRVNSFVLEIGVASLSGLLMGLSVSSYDGVLYQGLLVYPFTLLSPAPIEQVIPMLCLILACAIGLSAGPAAVKIFSEERDIYFREASSGTKPLAYFIGKNISATYRFVIAALHFTALFHFFATPNSMFPRMFFIHLLMFYCIYGVAFAVSMLVKRENSSLAAVCVMTVFAVLSGGAPNINDMNRVGLGWLLAISYGRWAAEAWYSDEVMLFENVYEIYTISAQIFGYTLNRYFFDALMIFILGIAWRIVAFLLLIGLNRQKQR